jgi:hydrogenase/urease accessory protein HupE
MNRRIAPFPVAALLLVHAAPASAHSVGISRGDYRVSGGRVEVELTFARPELASAIPGLDGDRDGALSAADVQAAAPRVAEALVERLVIRSAKAVCPGALEGVRLAEEDGVVIRATYRCERDAEGIVVRAGFLDSLSLGHRHLATLAQGTGHDEHAVLYEGRPEAALMASRGEERPDAVAGPLFRLGIEHILTGYDHLLFLLGLILVGGSLRPLALVVSAFTLAHSLTLGLAALGVWAPSPRLVEPAIALSIAYVGVENWFVRDASSRWMITFPFGLVHGFGFAGALGQISLPSSQIPLALAAFNVGVEAGQLAVLVAVLPAVLWLGRQGWFAKRGVKVVSAAIALAGIIWFFGRVT